MLTDGLLLLAGLALLIGAGDMLVRGAVAMSLRLGLAAMLVSATVVAFGTSAPELLVSVEAALSGAPGIALGNVVGSNIANVFLVLGIPALIAPIAPCGPQAHRNTYFMLVATAAFSGLMLTGIVTAWGGLILLAIAFVMVGDSVREAMRPNGDTSCTDLSEIEDVDPGMAQWKIAGLVAAGLVGLPLGAHLLIDGAQGIARTLGVSEAVIGVTIVALGTSLPELATTVVAAMRNHAAVAIGNVIGSNIFNLTVIIGGAALFAPLPVPDEILSRDLWIMILATLALLPFVLREREICRMSATVYLLAYVTFVALAATGVGAA